MAPLVSVRVITYNHERYIAQCLDGILMQQTDFAFEIVIGEDCSTDRTRDIVRQYQARYPEIIRVITAETNVGAPANTRRVAAACRGEYHAFCEGDDYWTDAHKLRKQVAFLATHPDYAMCFHDVERVRDGKALPAAHPAVGAPPTTVPIADIILRRVSIPLASVLVRAAVIAGLPAWRFNVWAPDLVMRLWCAHQGHIGYLHETMSVYRIHGAGLTAATSHCRKFLDAIYVYSEFDRETGYRYTSHLQQAIRDSRRSYREFTRRERFGKWYDLLFPHRLAARLLRRR